MRSLAVQAFINDLPRRLAAIEQGAASRDLAILVSLLHELRLAAGGCGLDAIARRAEQLATTAEVTSDLKELEILIQDLAGLCRRAHQDESTT
jgi:HPt (histidine-containing phosphotransfer) domain-containing protein